MLKIKPYLEKKFECSNIKTINNFILEDPTKSNLSLIYFNSNTLNTHLNKNITAQFKFMTRFVACNYHER